MYRKLIQVDDEAEEAVDEVSFTCAPESRDDSSEAFSSASLSHDPSTFNTITYNPRNPSDEAEVVGYGNNVVNDLASNSSRAGVAYRRLLSQWNDQGDKTKTNNR